MPLRVRVPRRLGMGGYWVVADGARGVGVGPGRGGYR